MTNYKLRVNSIESFSTKDGDGVRSVVFLQGCHLACDYCHNPETWDMKGGEEISAEELAEKVLRFKDYWGGTGGVTISGGEPLLQAEALSKFVDILMRNNVHIALNTSGAIINDDVRTLLMCCNLVILDYKDEKTFRAFRSEMNRLRSGRPRTIVRIVIVPGVNDTEEAMIEYARVLKGERVELVPFHTLGFDKYEKLGIVNPLAGTKAMSMDRLRELQGRLNQAL